MGERARGQPPPGGGGCGRKQKKNTQPLAPCRGEVGNPGATHAHDLGRNPQGRWEGSFQWTGFEWKKYRDFRIFTCHQTDLMVSQNQLSQNQFR